ncbi:MAG: DUF2797 domain-containing protein [Halioglobus sp.]|nr:DUF2797 domain-containing protein [Halioglobus sp.]
MAQVIAAGAVRKMKTELEEPVAYTMLLGNEEIPLNPFLGQSLQLDFAGSINCIHCGRKTNKSFSQGYCYPCFKRLAQCDSCIVSPEKCHYAAGTCREPEWGDAHCMVDHFVYLANTSGVKVGITRGTQVPTRWIDQGATQARPVYRVATRLYSGLVETVFKAHIADKTNWRTMLKGEGDPCDLESVRRRLAVDCAEELDALIRQHGLSAITALPDQAEVRIIYPVLEYPVKVTSFNLDKTPTVSGTLMGIKGQYLLFDTGVINMRKYSGYRVSLSRIG